MSIGSRTWAMCGGSGGLRESAGGAHRGTTVQRWWRWGWRSARRCRSKRRGRCGGCCRSSARGGANATRQGVRPPAASAVRLTRTPHPLSAGCRRWFWISFCKFYWPRAKWAKFAISDFFSENLGGKNNAQFEFLNKKQAKIGRKTAEIVPKN